MVELSVTKLADTKESLLAEKSDDNTVYGTEKLQVELRERKSAELKVYKSEKLLVVL